MDFVDGVVVIVSVVHDDVVRGVALYINDDVVDDANVDNVGDGSVLLLLLMLLILILL